MSRRYDSRTTMFSPEGRLYQVEYAIEAISKAGVVVGITAEDGVVLVAEKKISSKVHAVDCSHHPVLCHASCWCFCTSVHLFCSKPVLVPLPDDWGDLLTDAAALRRRTCA